MTEIEIKYKLHRYIKKIENILAQEDDPEDRAEMAEYLGTWASKLEDQAISERDRYYERQMEEEQDDEDDYY